MILLNRELTLKNIEDLLFDEETISLDKEAIDRIVRSFEFLREFSKEKVIYGINTGFGPMSQFRVDDRNLKQLQYNLIRSHAAGTGEILTDLQVKAAMIARLVTFVQGCSGVHCSLPLLLVECINREILPVIPQHGSVGASGDLVQLAHMALALIGEGDVHYRSKTRNAGEVLKENGLEPLQIHIREGLAITNGTSVMTGIGLLNLFRAKRLMQWAMSASALVNEIAGSYDDFLSPVLNGKKRHSGQLFIARQLSSMLSESHCLKRRQSFLYNKEVNGDKVFRDKVKPFY